MKLEEGVYSIPADCTVYYCGRKVYVKKMKKRSDKKHCSDCLHQKWGRKTLSNQFYDSPYCEVKPKIINGEEGYFYNAQSSKVACNDFKPREDEEIASNGQGL